MEEAIHVEDLTFRYPDYPEVRFPLLFENLNFSLKKGEIGVILGKPDSGKSTLSRILAGLVPRHTGGTVQGHVTVMDVDVTQTTPCDSIDRIGIVFQNPEEQIISTRCDSEVAFALESLGLSRDTIEQRVGEALSFLDLSRFRDRNPATLSHGEKKKLLFTCLYAIDPEIFLLDETFEEIDPPSRRRILEFLKKNGKSAIVLSAKLLNLYRDYCDRLFLLSSREIIETRGPEPEGDFLARSRSEGVIPGSWFRLSEKLDTKRPAVRTHPLVEIKGLRFQYPAGERPAADEAIDDYESLAPFALEIESLEFYRGEVLSILGRNGSGKSTLGKLLCGLLTPESGSIKISPSGSLVEATSRQLNSFAAYMFQNPDYQIFLSTIDEELSYGLKVIGLSHEEIRDRVSKAAKLFGLPDPSTPPTLMGYGARKKLQAAVYYLLNRSFTILDEADSGVSLRDFLNILSHFSNRDRATVVVTHDVELARTVSDRIVLLEDGKIRSLAERAGFEELATRFDSGGED